MAAPPVSPVFPTGDVCLESLPDNPLSHGPLLRYSPRCFPLLPLLPPYLFFCL